MEPAARQVERVAGPQDEVVGRLAVLPERLRVALVLQRELEQRVVEEPALLAGHLEDEHVVGVVVHGEALRAARRVVGVRLNAETERFLELPAEDRQRQPVHVQRLEDDRRARLPLGEDAGDVHRLREGGPPGDVGGVGADVELPTLAHQPESGIADRRGADQPLDVGLGEEVVEAARLVPRDDERPLLPMLGEERVGGDGVEAARERGLRGPSYARVAVVGVGVGRVRVGVVGVRVGRVAVGRVRVVPVCVGLRVEAPGFADGADVVVVERAHLLPPLRGRRNATTSGLYPKGPGANTARPVRRRRRPGRPGRSRPRRSARRAARRRRASPRRAPGRPRGGPRGPHR